MGSFKAPIIGIIDGRTMTNSSVRWLRISYWSGAILDVAAGLMMVFPALFVLMNHPVSFQPDPEFRYAMGMGAPLMFGWTILLLWADRKPLERKEVLPITLFVVLGEMTIQIWGIAVGFIPFQSVATTFILQIALIALFVFSYLNARKIK
jgi:hypothetical protein